MAESPAAPSPEQVNQGTEVAAAAMEAANAEPDPSKRQAVAERVVEREAKVRFEVSDEDAKKIAAQTVQMMAAAGAFDPPPAPVTPPAPAAHEHHHADTAPGQQEEAPQPRSFAERFRSH